jgi:putative alpha-1,2-mannosidase
MSAWFVFSALGFYPVCPGDPTYIIGSPLFARATLNLASGKMFTVNARNNGSQHPYIRKAALNGGPFNRTFLTHEELVKGGEVVFEMASAPDYKWATSPERRPPASMRRTAAPPQSPR